MLYTGAAMVEGQDPFLKAVQALLGQPAFAGRQPVFVGDDVTDEDGIRVVQAAGGFGVRVGPGATQARYRLADTDAVGAWLQAALRAAAQNPTEYHAK